jgi:hypothetical protein
MFRKKDSKITRHHQSAGEGRAPFCDGKNIEYLKSLTSNGSCFQNGEHGRVSGEGWTRVFSGVQ